MHTNLITSLKWVATLFIAISALQVSLSVTMALLWWSFVGFLIGHVMWTTFAYRMRDWPLLGLNTFFIFVDLYAIFVRI